MSYTPGPWVVAFSAGTPDGVCLVRNLHNFEAFTEAQDCHTTQHMRAKARHGRCEDCGQKPLETSP